MKKVISLITLMIAGLQTVSAQGFRVYQSDGTEMQFSMKTDSIVFDNGLSGDEVFGPFTPVNQCITGTWYKTKSETVTFNLDGTMDYMDGATYEFMPYQGNIIIYNASCVPMNILKVYKVTAEKMIVGSHDGNSIKVWATTPQPQLVEEIVLSKTLLALQLDETTELTATVLPADADNKEVTWESSDEVVALVGNVFGVNMVKAVGVGTCIITCRATDGSGVYAECSVIVTDVQLVMDIVLSEASLTLPTNSSQTLMASVLPADATNEEIIWSSSNVNVATVDQIGKVTAIAVGSCTITATASDGSGVKADCSVTVIQLVTDITLSQTSMKLYTNGRGYSQFPENGTLTATVLPTNATNNNIIWSSSDTNIATIDQTGKVNAVTQGSCIITATAADDSGVKAECLVTVEKLKWDDDNPWY